MASLADQIARLGDAKSPEAKGERLLLRGDPGPDPLGALTALLERLMPT